MIILDDEDHKLSFPKVQKDVFRMFIGLDDGRWKGKLWRKNSKHVC